MLTSQSIAPTNASAATESTGIAPTGIAPTGIAPTGTLLGPSSARTERIELSSEISVELVDHAASDLGVAKAARVSTAGEQANREDRDDTQVSGLIRYLMRCRHGSPFEHNYMTFLVTAPIFTVRHLMRHRTWSFNEESARYGELRPRFYVPDEERHLKQVGKPGHYQYVPGDEGDHERLLSVARHAYTTAYEGYSELLNAGIARELARMVLPGATFSTVFATCNARALMHFLSLRTHRPEASYPSSPQREIELVAEQMEVQFAALMPATHSAFESFGRVSP